MPTREVVKPKEGEDDGVAYLTAEQVAERFGVGVRTVHQWRRAGLLRALDVGIGRRHIYRFDEADVDELARRLREEK